MKLISLLVVSLLATVSAASWAQWQWIDKDGRKVFSDRAPAPDVPEKSILKRPPGRSAPATPQTENAGAVGQQAAAQATSPAASAPKPLPGLDKELEAKKKAAQEAESAKKKAEEEKLSKAKADNCARAKQAKATFDSGIRIARTNATGEREIMDDNTRATEQKRIQGVLDNDCK